LEDELPSRHHNDDERRLSEGNALTQQKDSGFRPKKVYQLLALALKQPENHRTHQYQQSWN
jgi:hypothetical protein